MDVATHVQLAVASGAPRNLCPKQCVRHVPAMERAVTFCVGPHLDADVKKALKRIAGREDSKFSIAEGKGKGSAPAVYLGELRDVVSWACSARRVRNESGPKTVAADGRRMPT